MEHSNQLEGFRPRPGTAGQASQGNNHNACGSSTGASGRGRISPVASNISNNLDGCFKSDTAHKPAVPTAPEVLPLGVACGGQPRASSEHVGVSQLGQDSNRDSVHSPKEAIAELYARWQTEGQASAQDGCPLDPVKVEEDIASAMMPAPDGFWESLEWEPQGDMEWTAALALLELASSMDTASSVGDWDPMDIAH